MDERPIPPTVEGGLCEAVRSLDTEEARAVLRVLEDVIGSDSRVRLRDEPGDEAPLLAAQAPAIPLGRGNFVILGEVARGGMGVILKARDVDLGRSVALKVLKEEYARDPRILQRFVEEAQIGGQLQHPGIVPVYELGLLADQRPYFAMKLIRGRTLARLLRERASPDEDHPRFLAIFEQVCQTVAYAHSRGVIHRDLKPANVMVGAFGELQVFDWGLAKVLEQAAPGADAAHPWEHSGIIETVRKGAPSGETPSIVGAVLGTPDYMPPEQAQGRVDKLDERSDVFSLGAILCEILTGFPPYGASGDTLAEAAAARLDGAFDWLDGCGADRELVELAKRCLAPAQVARPRHAGVVAEAMTAYLSALERRARAAEVAAAAERARAGEERKARRLTLVLAAVVTLSLIAGGAVLGWFRGRAEQRRQRVAQRVNDELRHASELRGGARFAEALAAAERAETLLASAEPIPEIADRTQRLVAEVRADAESARASAARGERDRGLSDRLEATFLDLALDLDVVSDGRRNSPIVARQRAARFAAAFDAFGLGIDPLGDPAATIRAIRETGIADFVGIALDEWSRAVWELQRAEAEGLLRIAREVDPEPTRNRIRAALLADDDQALREIDASAAARELHPVTTVTFGMILYERDLCTSEGHEARLRAALKRYADDVLLNQGLGAVLYEAGRWDEALVYFAVVQALRPESMAPLLWLHRAAADAADVEWAEYAYAKALELGPADERTVSHLNYPRTVFCYVLGRDEEGDRAHARIAALGDTYRERWPRAHFLGMAAWRLCRATPADGRDYERAAELAARALEETPDAHRLACEQAFGTALYYLGDLDEALPYLASSVESARPTRSKLLMAMAYERKGERELALQWYHATDPVFVGGRPGDRSLPSLRAEAAALLGVDPAAAEGARAAGSAGEGE